MQLSSRPEIAAPSAPTLGRVPLIAFTAAFAGLMPMATDIYLVLMPAIARDFGASLAATHASMAALALGFGLAHLFVGVLADRYGRRPVAIVSAVAFLAATSAVVTAPTLEILTVCRFVQGLVIAACPILGRTLVRDLTPPDRAARVYSQVHAVAALSPLSAPFIAAAGAAWGGWRAAMGLLVIYGVLLLLAVVLRLPETRPPLTGQELSPIGAARQILFDPRFAFGALISMLLYSALFTWLSTSPFLMIDTLGFSPTDVAIVMGLGSLGYMAGSLASARLSGRHSPQRLIALGAPLMLAGALGGLLALSRASPGPYTTLVAVLPFYLGLGFARANALQIVMRPFPHMAGQASAWLGALQQVAGVVVSVLAVQAGAGFAALVVMIVRCLGLALASAVVPRLIDRPGPAA
jgi:DHA1 family bicyclomycin/chloramphenicol resistance-like MFS transporter